jgi:DNA-binding CsgD family transcriptional regulator
MHDWNIITPESITKSPNDTIYENFQVLGFVFASTKEAALGKLKENYPYLKGSGFDELWIYQLSDDEVPMSEDLAYKILQEFTTQKEKKSEKNPLSAREKEVLELVAKGKTNKKISVELNISEYTVKNHLKNILQKLHLENRVQLTRYAYESGWIDKD